MVAVATVLPANVLSGPWVSGPLSIDAKRQNELLKALREQAIEKLNPYKDKLKDAGYETVCTAAVDVSSARKVALTTECTPFAYANRPFMSPTEMLDRPWSV